MSNLTSSISLAEVNSSLASPPGMTIEIGPFWVNIRSKISDLGRHIKLLYSDYSIIDEHFADFHVSLKKPVGIRHWIQPQVNFFFDDTTPFKPLPYDQAYPFFEWGLNWCIATMAHQYLIIHSAVVAKDGRVLILPGKPGAGKSTLCAALINNGWMLLSDEMALVDPLTNNVTPIPRPVSLKNESIDIIRSIAPDTVFGPIIEDTHKGTVTHIKPPKSCLIKTSKRFMIQWVVFPEFKNNAAINVSYPGKARALIQLAGETFNYGTLGLTSFRTLEKIVSNSNLMHFSYSNLDDALEWFNNLAEVAETGTKL